MTIYKLNGLQLDTNITVVNGLDVSSFGKDIHDAEPGDVFELDDGRQFTVIEFEISLDVPPKFFVSMNKKKT